MTTSKQKCCLCAKKVGFFGIKCRCTDASGTNLVYCSLCIPTKINESDPGHFCSFDYKHHERAVILKNNQSVTTIKVDSI